MRRTVPPGGAADTSTSATTEGGADGSHTTDSKLVGVSRLTSRSRRWASGRRGLQRRSARGRRAPADRKGPAGKTVEAAGLVAAGFAAPVSVQRRASSGGGCRPRRREHRRPVCPSRLRCRLPGLSSGSFPSRYLLAYHARLHGRTGCGFCGAGGAGRLAGLRAATLACVVVGERVFVVYASFGSGAEPQVLGGGIVGSAGRGAGRAVCRRGPLRVAAAGLAGVGDHRRGPRPAPPAVRPQHMINKRTRPLLGMAQ